MMDAFGPKIALVGVSTDETPIGEWVTKEIDGGVYQFFSIGRRSASARRPLIPERLSMFLALTLHKKKILSLGVHDAFTQAPEILIVVSRWQLKSICHRFPGVDNPLAMPRYRWGRLLANLFDVFLFKALHQTDIILASADETSIQGLIGRSEGQLDRQRVLQFPTRVDTGIFYPTDKQAVRNSLQLPADCFLIVSCGRINRVKGWDFLLECFHLFLNVIPEARLIFVGDGEDAELLKNHAASLGVDQKIQLTGFQLAPMVAQYLNAADLVVVGSHKEGWSIAMLEALACGKNVVSTEVSGALGMITDGVNGFVVKERNPQLFAEAMNNTASLTDPNPHSIVTAEQYALKHLAKDISSLWPRLECSTTEQKS